MSDFRKDLEAPQNVPLTGRADRLIPPSAWKIGWRRIRHFVLTLLIIVILMVLVALAVMKGAGPRSRSHAPERTMRTLKPGSRSRSSPIPEDGSPREVESFG
jgi:hypothetical protein